MPEKLFERLKHQNYFMTTNLNIVKFLLGKGVVPYNNKKDKNRAIKTRFKLFNNGEKKGITRSEKIATM